MKFPDLPEPAYNGLGRYGISKGYSQEQMRCYVSPFIEVLNDILEMSIEDFACHETSKRIREVLGIK